MLLKGRTMSDARLTWKPPLHGVIHEVISGMSALNMEPDPIAEPTGTYLSETDGYVKHAMEHFSAACQLAGEAERRTERLVTLAARLLELKHGIETPYTCEDAEAWVTSAIAALLKRGENSGAA
jgi:hypothetical protein